jgi:hypothetical protein
VTRWRDAQFEACAVMGESPPVLEERRGKLAVGRRGLGEASRFDGEEESTDHGSECDERYERRSWIGTRRCNYSRVAFTLRVRYRYTTIYGVRSYLDQMLTPGSYRLISVRVREWREGHRSGQASSHRRNGRVLETPCHGTELAMLLVMDGGYASCWRWVRERLASLQIGDAIVLRRAPPLCEGQRAEKMMMLQTDFLQFYK